MSGQDSTKSRDAEMASVHRSERREVRYELPFEIEIAGLDRDGKAFHQRVFTRNISEWGCGFLSPIELGNDDIIAIRIISPKGPGARERPQVRFQVVRVEKQIEGWAIGAWKLDASDVWGIELERIAAPQESDVSRRKASGEDPNESGV